MVERSTPWISDRSSPVTREITFSIAPGSAAPSAVNVARSPLPIEKRLKLWKRLPPRCLPRSARIR
jgi:hypothetical protein